MATVETRSGKLAGLYENKVFVYRGVPYAKPPVNDRRWAPPEPRPPWSGVRWAQRFAHSAIQPPLPGSGELNAIFKDRAKQDEDCLHLNIWTPSIDHGSRPVMVWFHGGGFVSGSGAQLLYDGGRLAREGDVVVVTVNYRLGPLGFLRLQEVTNGRINATGNEGLLDQIAALEWIRDNIASFRGDPGNVTVFGESAGAMSIGALLASPKAKGLFHKAIAQSGAASTAQTVDQAAETAARILRVLKIGSADEHVLRLMPAKALVEAGAIVRAKTGRMSFQPVMGDTVLPQLPLELIKAGAADGIPVLVGTTQHEWRSFMVMDPDAKTMDDKILRKRLARRIPGTDLSDIADPYRALFKEAGEPSDPISLINAIETDRVFRLPSIRLAEALTARGQPVYQYIFSWHSPANDYLGACHAIDLGFTFGTHASTADLGKFFGSGTHADILSAMVRNSWTAFAHTGNPGNERLMSWTPYSAETRSTTLLGAQPGLVEAPEDNRRQIWNQYKDGDVIGFL